jgi:hypothetical protein
MDKEKILEFFTIFMCIIWNIGFSMLELRYFSFDLIGLKS